jgi:hypothetical protein
LTVVEVRYAEHLLPSFRRLVVCKELCHSVEAPDGKHAVSDDGIDDLVAAFSMASRDIPPSHNNAQSSPEFGVELLATTTAIEILCPFPLRKRLLKAGGTIDHADIANKCCIPSRAVQMAFNETYNGWVEELMTAYGVLL